MRVTWTRQVAGFKGNVQQCRNEEEAARLVLQLFLAGLSRYQIIVDGQYIGDKGVFWIWDALHI